MHSDEPEKNARIGYVDERNIQSGIDGNGYDVEMRTTSNDRILFGNFIKLLRSERMSDGHIEK